MFNILLCSQRPAHLLSLDHALRRADYACRITTEWDVVLGVAQQSYVEAILLDAAIDDVENLCRQLRHVSGLPLIVISTHGDADESDRLLAAGADSVLAAGASFQELLAHIEGKLRRSQVAVV